MKRAAQIAKYLMIAFAALIALGLVSSAIWWAKLPRYDGESVYYWFRSARMAANFRPAGPGGPTREEIEQAFIRMGPGGIDFLLDRLKLDNRPKPFPPLVQKYQHHLARFEWGRQFLTQSAREDWFTADRVLSSLVRRLQGKPETLLPVIEKVLKAPDPRLRAGILQQVQNFGPAAAPAVSHIAQALEDPYVYVRAEAAKALGAIGPQATSALDKLKAREQDSHSEVVQAARAAQQAIQVK